MPENPTESEIPTPQSTSLPQQTPIPPPLTPSPLPQPTQLLRSATPPSSTAPTLPEPEPLNPTPPTLSPVFLPPPVASPPQHVHAHDFVLNNPQFIHFSPSPYALCARYPPPKCHLGTRKDYIALVTNWALGASDRKEPILWMRGPFGIGKSAVAQSCAEALAPINKLAATLFFSRSNPDRDDPRRIFTSIAYQVAATCPSFREIVDRRMINDPALAKKSLSTQFEDLLVHPLARVDIAESGLDGCVVIIDGLDECRGTAAQCEIIKVIATSARNRTTPFRWFITSRPEDAINRTMNSTAMSPVCSRIELRVSRAIDHEILIYLTDEFKKIQEDYGLPESWPSEEALALLVERGAGLWIYVATMVRFVKDENSYGPKDQLQIVLKFMKDLSAKAGADNPLAEMDLFYALIMQRTPLKLRTTIRKILLICSSQTSDTRLAYVANVLRLSTEQLRRACASLQSVMELKVSDSDSTYISFYHTSFLDFMKDPQRSRELCIYGDFLIESRRELLVVSYSDEGMILLADSSHIVFPSDTIPPEDKSYAFHYTLILYWFWNLCQVPAHRFDPQSTMSVAGLPFNKMLMLAETDVTPWVRFIGLRDNASFQSSELRDKIIRMGKCSIPGCTNTENVFILGHGENESVPVQANNGFLLTNNRDPSDGTCFCSARKAEEEY
ncbi:hypothetical protein D9756_010857 [Leucocoprinus leucothites]|uniref:Nephrocystin 3-like N-terminal domain-containing protein n=1 Tax=Leucocoprinus leucothites TaxID=201217 RepID=A0A8H5FQF1_9AGAR|nr:hypothetical protein D9756_010857 [Leucoagaricus leucothites]